MVPFLTLRHRFSVPGSMLEIYLRNVAAKQVTDVSLVLKDSDTESENLSTLIRLSVSDGKKVVILFLSRMIYYI